MAKTLITNKLAACVTILPNTHSIYYWENQIQKQEEIQLIIKTCATLEQSVFQYIKTKHPYQIPELLTLKITNGEPNYLLWIYNLLN
ncbi:divalent-cation tolerance protein CutA [Blochmannia endosymbiont of Polyrhachis (Hedomyrma) turneri]|uniref:divalent-cation tolerance protein CutA n=1 Tax=Blochmannia endosymbiont of Polyrhachis (Hedomyrma) turneri TaxID=1505596 RepID=UPI001FE05124|nr:divalent-cation tolerance protein CutA [Blochmannia endosymbiont of Polyrhachis (Hedomyrma) turneri]